MSEILKDVSEWKLAGHFGVDAGLCWIGDPGYILHREEGLPSTLGKNWGDFVDKLDDKAVSFAYELGHEGLGICTQTGYGDGSYPVYVRIQKGRVAQLFIDFMGNGIDEDGENYTVAFAKKIGIVEPNETKKPKELTK